MKVEQKNDLFIFPVSFAFLFLISCATSPSTLYLKSADSNDPRQATTETPDSPQERASEKPGIIVQQELLLEENIQIGEKKPFQDNTLSSSFPIIELPQEEEEEEFIIEEITYDVPIIINESVEAYIGFFQVRIRDRFEKYLNRSGRYLGLMKEIFKKNGLPEDLVFVALIESGFNPYAYSRSRAVGPWQFIKGTGRKYGLRINAWIDERRDPVKSTHAASRYLKDLYEMFGSWPLALASYNAGEGRVKRALIKAKGEDFWDLKSTRYIRKETRDYVPKFMAATIIAKNPEHYGFNIDYHEPLKYDEVKVDRPTDLRLMAKAIGVSYKELKLLNPELKTTITPPNYKDYRVNLPEGTKQTFLENFHKIPEDQRALAFRHEVQRGQTLWGLARQYGTTISDLQELNNMGRRTRLREGEYLVVPLANKFVDLGPTYASKGSSKNKGDKRKIYYRVKRGDSLWKISKKYKVSIKNLKKWNNLKSHRIYPGKRLVLVLGRGNL